MIKLNDLIQVKFSSDFCLTKSYFYSKDIQTKSPNNSEELLLNLLQIRIYLSMFRLGSNYTVQVY
jgi:hypothetical protein